MLSESTNYGRPPREKRRLDPNIEIDNTPPETLFAPFSPTSVPGGSPVREPLNAHQQSADRQMGRLGTCRGYQS
ncbi:hypothetical protein R1flu_001726 [Riccia fluitans]|uniref:Engrailed n=1 Tax=Riccia fluitans TaxID=41844 RepID=A0ABD1Y435_9MARC